jgi:hypothetical protein
LSTGKNSWGFSLFCDDLRPEIGGKFSIMGIYQNDMVFPPGAVFPLLIPKFCILIKYYEVPHSIKEDLEVRVFFPGDEENSPSIKMPLPRAVIEETGLDTPYPLESDQERINNMTFPLTISPFTVKQNGWVKVRMAYGESVVNLGSLMLRVADPTEDLQFSH